jgi:hypothetical protein
VVHDHLILKTDKFEVTILSVDHVSIRENRHPRDPSHFRPKSNGRRRAFLEGFAACAMIAIVSVASFWGTNALVRNLLDYSGPDHSPSVVAQQNPYRDDLPLTREMVQNKYQIRLLAQDEVGSGFDPPTSQAGWSQSELHLIDRNLANIPAEMYEEVNGRQLSIFIGSLAGSRGDVVGGVCGNQCGGIFDFVYNGYGGLIGLDRGSYNEKNPSYDQTILVHELTHRKYYETRAAIAKDLKSLLDGNNYLKLPEFSDQSRVNDSTARYAIMALKSFASGEDNPKNPHLILPEGVAETSEIYCSGYAVFMMEFGPELNGGGYTAYEFPIMDNFLANEFPQADALYRLWQKDIFGGYGYNPFDGSLVKGDLAIPAQIDPTTWLQSPIPSDSGN